MRVWKIKEDFFYLFRHCLFVNVLVRIVGRRGLKICDFLAQILRGQSATMVTHEAFVEIDLFLDLKVLI